MSRRKNKQETAAAAPVKERRQQITAYDPIDSIDQIVGMLVSPERYASAQPSGYQATVSNGGKTWAVFQSNRIIDGQATNLDGVKQAIMDWHNKQIDTTYRQAAVAWRKHYETFPQDKAVANPDLVAAIYELAATTDG